MVRQAEVQGLAGLAGGKGGGRLGGAEMQGCAWVAEERLHS